MSELSAADRSWVVAGLTLAGLTAEEIRDRLACSLRSVRAIRAEPMTQICLIYQREVDNFANEMRLAVSSSAGLRRALHDATIERDRLRSQLDNVLDARMVGESVDVCGRGHLLTAYNTYINNGRRWCRECHAERQRDYRLAKRLGVGARQVREAREAGTLAAFVETVLATCSTRRAATG